MSQNKLQRRIGGLKICPACSDLEMECAPYVYILRERVRKDRDDLRRLEGFALQPKAITIFDNFSALRRSADCGCHICLIWHKAIMNECFAKIDEERLLASDEPVRIELPSAVDDPVPFSAFIKILSPKQAHVRIADTFQWNRSDGNVKIEQDPLAEELWEHAQKTLEDCQSNHKSCVQKADRTSLPTRLIHIQDSISVTMRDTAGLRQDLSYAALSYAWGGDQVVKLTAELESRLRGTFPQSEFPRTLQDTFRLCRQLAIDYVWIDALCIRQDDRGVDFNAESERMDQIYGFATITIVAATAQSAEEGFLETRLLERDYAINPRRTHFADGQLFVPRKGLSEVRSKSPLALRAWCFQEELLSTRLIYCTSHGAFWSCSEHQLAEHRNPKGDISEFESVVPTMEPHFFLKSSDRLYIWDQLVEQYSVRNVTLPEDRLPAIRGLAKSIEQLAHENLLFGMWQCRLPVQLLWITVDLKPELKPDESRRVPLKEIPSWSWASTPPMQAVRMPGPQISYSKAKLLDVSPSQDTLSLQGRLRPLLVDHRELEHWPVIGSIQGATARAFMETDQESNLWASSKDELFICEEGRDPIVIQLDRMPRVPFHNLVCFEINYKGLLLLEPGLEKYRRVGCSQFHNDNAFFAGAETKTIELG